MKSKKLRVVALILVAVIIGGAIGWFMRKSESPATASAQVASAAKTEAAKPVVQAAPVAQVELPKVAAVAAKPETAGSKAEADALAQAELKATVQGMARTMRDKGLTAWILDYYPPEIAIQHSPDEIRQRLEAEAANAQDSQEQQSRETHAQKYDYLATLTPTLNATGDKAIYYGNFPIEDTPQDAPPKIIAILIKINGKWYWQTDWSGE